MHIARGGIAVSVPIRNRSSSADARGKDGDGIDQAKSLMDLQHVGAAVEPSLGVGIGLGLVGGEAEVGERRRLGILIGRLGVLGERGALLAGVAAREGQVEGWRSVCGKEGIGGSGRVWKRGGHVGEWAGGDGWVRLSG